LAAITKTNKRVQTVPYQVMIAVYVAFIAMYTSDDHNIILPILGILGMLPFVVPFRLPQDNPLVWPIRFVVYGVLIAANSSRLAQIDSSAMLGQGMDNLGVIAAGEISVRLWRQSSEKASEIPSILFWTGVVFLAACQVHELRYTRIYAPILFFLLMLAFPVYRSRPAHRLNTQIGRFATYCRVFFVLIALAAGFAVFEGFTTYQNQITQLGEQILNGSGDPTNLDVSGISKSPTLSDSFNASGSTARMLRLFDYDGDPHLRGMAFDTYNRGEWQPAVSARQLVSATSANLNSEAIGHRCIARRLVQDDGVAFFPLNAIGLDSEDATDRHADFEQGGPVVFTGALPLEYTIVLPQDPDKRGFFNQDPDGNETRFDLVVPHDIDPKVGLIAKEIGAGLTTPQAKINAVEDYLLENNSYSLKTQVGHGDPLSSFIIEKKSADCEYFASAAVMLLRCLGVPSRFVIGYYAHESDGPGVTIIRGDDAHAWTESWIKGVGWVTVDATPGDGRPDKTSSVPPFYVRWQEWADDRLQIVRDWLTQLTPVQLGLLVGTILVGIGAFIYVRSRMPRKRTASRTAYTPSEAEIQILADRFERWLKDRHIPCPDPTTWHEHLSHHVSDPEGDHAPEELTAALRFVEHYYALRFGSIDEVDSSRGDREEIASRLKRELDTLEALDRKTPAAKERVPLER